MLKQKLKTVAKALILTVPILILSLTLVTPVEAGGSSVSCPSSTTLTSENLCCPSQFVKSTTRTSGSGKNRRTITTLTCEPPTSSCPSGTTNMTLTDFASLGASTSSLATLEANTGSSYCCPTGSLKSFARPSSGKGKGKGSAAQVGAVSDIINSCTPLSPPPNADPGVPVISTSLPSTGYRNVDYSTEFSATDPNGDTVRYRTSVTDYGTNYIPTSGHIASGSMRSILNSWTSLGEKTVSIGAYDVRGAWSGWITQYIDIVNRTPAIPTILGVTSGQLNTPYTFTFNTTDPDSDTVRYGIDWDDNDSIDSWAPSSGYVSSGSDGVASKSWVSDGIYTFKARAYDSIGAYSDWITHTITIPNTPPTLPIINSLSCIIGADNEYGFKSNDPSDNIYYEIDFNNDGVDTRIPSSGYTPAGEWVFATYSGWNTQGQKNLRVRSTDTSGETSGWKHNLISCNAECVDPVVCDGGSSDLTLSAFPPIVSRGSTTNINWNLRNVLTCSITGTSSNGSTVDTWGWDIVGSQTQQETNDIETETTYVLSCTDLDGVDSSKSVTVKVVPTWQER